MDLSNLPNFFIIGAAKAGTSSLYAYLKQHPQIFMSAVKEPHFFSHDANYAEGIDVYLDRYFRGAAAYPARGEATPGYLHRYPVVIPRLLEIYVDKPPRFIVMLRDPVKRAWSHYLHRKALALETEPFERAIGLEDARLAQNPASWVGYYTDGNYSRQLEVWLRSFPREQFLFILTDDLRTDSAGTLQTVFTFLGVDASVTVDTSERENSAAEPRSAHLMRWMARPSPIKGAIRLVVPRWARWVFRSSLRRANLRSYQEPPKMDAVTARMLRQRYTPEIKRLEAMIDRDLSIWMQA